MSFPATDKATAAPRRKRRWFQFGLGTLLGLVTVLSVVLGLWVERAERQRRVVAFVRSVGGHVYYQDEIKRYHYHPVAPAWLRELVAEDYFRTVDIVYLSDSQVSDAGLEHLRGLTELRVLYLNRTQVSDAGLQHLKGLTELRLLWLFQTQVSEAGIAELRAAQPRCFIVGPEGLEM